MEINDYVLNDGTPWRVFTPESANHQWAVLWLQGFTSTIDGHTDGCIRMSESSKITFAILNYAGHGNHPVPLESATRKQQLEEVCSVYDGLVKLGYSKIIVIGGSFGGYMAALLSGVRAPETVVLRAPAMYRDDEFEANYSDTARSKGTAENRIYNKIKYELATNFATSSLGSFSGKTYVIEHGADAIIDPKIPRAYYETARHGNHIVISGLKHTPRTMRNGVEYYDIVERWISTIIEVTLRDPSRLRD